MANKCTYCGKFLVIAECAKCSLCSSIFHRQCVNISPSSRVPANWLCRGCKMTSKCQSGSTVSLGESTERMSASNTEEDITLKTLVYEIRHMQKQLTTVMHEMTSFKQELAAVSVTVSEFSTRVNTLEERISTLESVVQKQQETPNTENTLQVIDKLKADLNDREQECISNDVEISGLVEKSGENLTNIILLVANKIGVRLEDRDIISVDRSGRTAGRPTSESGEQRPRRIVVRLARRSVRDDMVRAARVRRGCDSSGIIDTEPRKFYVNERLTFLNRQLFYKAREEARHKGCRYVWTKGGRIFMRRSPETTVQRIRTENDIKKFFESRII